MQNTIFECGLCFLPYDSSERKPLTLPCGHVYCLTCLRQMSHKGDLYCTEDKTAHKVSVSELPCCYAILSNLPEQTKTTHSLVFHCNRHPKKKTKFLCLIHKEYLCTNCVLEHTGVGHQIVPFKADCKLELIIDRRKNET